MTKKINRKKLITKHNPVLTAINIESPLTIGNGDFAFTADITGLQTLYNEYEIAPLCTMSSWGWHSMPSESGKFYTFDDAAMTRYDINGRIYQYASEVQPGNEEVYHWLRHNPHRLNLAKIALMWENREIKPADITEIHQELELYSGTLKSKFKLFGYDVKVTTVCAKNADTVGFRIESKALEAGMFTEIAFPYGSHNKNASDWESCDRHASRPLHNTNSLILKRILDNDIYYVAINKKNAPSGICELTVSFSKNENIPVWDFEQVLHVSEQGWQAFWENGGMADFSRCKDKRANELERRMVLSQHLTAVHSAGCMPPQETGLMCNSWYGKFHIEMHILHSGWFALWGRAELLEKSLPWYERILPKAVENAARNGFKGARWPKMTSPEGVDCPSRIATLLIWQQPHIIYMLELISQAKPESERLSFKKRWWEIVKLTAEFMQDFAQYNETNGHYDLPPPLIPAQEEHKPETALNPAFELCYWQFGLNIAANWANELGEYFPKWKQVCKKLAPLPTGNDGYAAHENCPDTFENYNKDHPSMLFGYGFIDSDKVNPEIMSKTIDKVLEAWDFESMWGWDFALMAMTLTRLGRRHEAVDVLLMETAKNSYVASGNNFQHTRPDNDLPLYLPGNGSLLFALALMLTGYGGNLGIIGFPEEWDIAVEGVTPLPV